MVRKSVEAPNWMKAKEPRDVRLVMELIAQVPHLVFMCLGAVRWRVFCGVQELKCFWQDVRSLSLMMREIDTEQDADGSACAKKYCCKLHVV